MLSIGKKLVNSQYNPVRPGTGTGPEKGECMAAPITRLYHEINDVTGFANGEKFDTAEQIRDYFTVANLHEMFGATSFLTSDGQDVTPPQDLLDLWATVIIRNRLHCNQEFEE